MFISKIVISLLKENKAKLLTIIRNLNAKYEYAHLAQYLMAELLPQFDCESFKQSFKDFEATVAKEKKQGKKLPPSSDLKSTLESTMIYEDKHYSRVER